MPYRQFGGSSLTTSQLPRSSLYDFRGRKNGSYFSNQKDPKEFPLNTQKVPSRERTPLQNRTSPNRGFDLSESASGLVASSIDQLRELLQAHGLQAQSAARAFGTTSSLHRSLLASPFRLLGRLGLRFLLSTMHALHVPGERSWSSKGLVTFLTFECFPRHHKSPLGHKIVGSQEGIKQVYALLHFSKSRTRFHDYIREAA